MQEVLTLPVSCSKIQSGFINGKESIFSLSHNMRLFINSKLFSQECTNFFLYQNFLLLITSCPDPLHNFYIYDMQRSLPKPASGNASDAPQLQSIKTEEGFNVRAIERGTRIVTASEMRVVLQMPRGNLEGIYPRFIMLQELIQLIEQKEYQRAFKISRQHKIDMNLIVDVNRDQFLSSVPHFLDQVSSVEYLNLFISSLNEEEESKELKFMRPKQEEQVIEEEHKQQMMQNQLYPQDRKEEEQENKVSVVCNALREELQKRNQ